MFNFKKIDFNKIKPRILEELNYEFEGPSPEPFLIGLNHTGLTDRFLKESEILKTEENLITLFCYAFFTILDGNFGDFGDEQSSYIDDDMFNFEINSKESAIKSQQIIAKICFGKEYSKTLDFSHLDNYSDSFF